MVPRKESGTPPPASLLLRVAEAADGLRDGKPHWFVVGRAAPHAVTPFDSAAEAEKALAKKGKGKFLLLGPYVTRPEAAPATTRRRKKKRKVSAVQIYFEGEKKPMDVDLTQVDAIFLSASARDKFMYPYYARVRGVSGTAQMRSSHVQSEEEVFFHRPWSDPWP